jgi:glycosyltransferase involved in cell wall biosynthesis
MKLISVVVPNYNCEEYLDKCLESVTSQTYKNLEIIVCDNGSEDGSVAIINQWAAKDPRIKVLINKENQGLINCYNRMFFEATGEYICIQDADDWCDLERVEKQARILDTHDVGLCVTNSMYYPQISEPFFEDFGTSRVVSLESREVWAPATIMFRSSILKEIPGYHSYFHKMTSYDRYFIMEILDKYNGYYLDECLYHVLARPRSDHRSIDLSDVNVFKKAISQDTYDELKRQRIATGTDWLKENDMEKMRAYEQKKLNDKDYIADKIRKFACIQIDYGNLKEGRTLLVAALKTSPFLKSNYRSILYYLKSRLSGNRQSQKITQ